MHRISRPLTTPGLLVVALMLSSCVGAAVQSMFLPQSHNAVYAGETASSAADVLYVQGTSPVSIISINGEQPIPGMTLSLPAATTTTHHALVTFNAPITLPQTTCVFTIYAGSTATPGNGETSIPSGANVIPVNIVIRLPLTTTKQTVAVKWHAVGTICGIETFYSLSAIITN